MRQVFKDFSGGICNLSENIPDNCVSEADNCFWDKGVLKKMRGWEISGPAYSYIGDYMIIGILEGVLSNALGANTYFTVAVFSNSSGVNTVKYYNYTTNLWVALTVVGSLDLSAGEEFKLVSFDDGIVGVETSGFVKPIYIDYPNKTIQYLEAWDTRTHSNTDWYAGQYTDVGAVYTDDTVDAQDTGAGDFQVATLTANDGFYVAGVIQFSKFILKTCSQFTRGAGDIVAEYSYYAGNSTWTTFTPTTKPAGDNSAGGWKAAAGDRTIEFDIPTAWTAWDGADATGGEIGSLNARYLIRVRFTSPTTDATESCDYIQVYNTHFLSMIMNNDVPTCVCVHGNRVWLSAYNAVNYSPVNSEKDWTAYQVEYCTEGGSAITAMISLGQTLLIFKQNAIYGIFGNSLDSILVKKILDIGCNTPSSPAVIDNTCYFFGTDRSIHAFNGETDQIISKYIESDIDVGGYTIYGVAWKRYYYLIFTWVTPFIYLCDVDTIRTDSDGNVIVSWWKHTYSNWALHYPFTRTQTRTLVVPSYIATASGGYNTFLMTLFSTNSYSGIVGSTVHTSAPLTSTQTTAYNMYFKTPYYTLVDPMTNKGVRKVNVNVKESGNWTFSAFSNYTTASVDTTIASSTGEDYYSTDIGLPYTLDGKNVALKLSNETTNPAEFYSFTLETFKRK